MNPDLCISQVGKCQRWLEAGREISLHSLQCRQSGFNEGGEGGLIWVGPRGRTQHWNIKQEPAKGNIYAKSPSTHLRAAAEKLEGDAET